MERVNPNRCHHIWIIIPELGPGWQYCPACGMAQRVSGGQLFTYWDALGIIIAVDKSRKEKQS